ncbi:phospholipase D-like domain-containing protein [Nannocystaceae bacterium ST9]
MLRAARVSSLLLLSLAVLGCDQPATTTPEAARVEATTKAGEGKGALALYLHEPGDQPGPSSACDVDLCTSLLALIEGAEHSIDFAIYGMRGQPDILSALERAKARGVVIRGVVDRDAQGNNYYTNTDQLAARLGDVRDDRKVDRELEREDAKRARGDKFSTDACKRPEGFAGFVQCLAYDLGDRCLLATHASREPFGVAVAGEDGEEPKAYNKIMHDKFFVVDGRWLWTGSTNVSDTCSGGYNANLALVVDSPTVAGWYTQEFETMWTEGEYHQKKPKSAGPRETKVGDAEVSVFFSPQDRTIEREVRPLIQAASKRIDIAVFFLTHKLITKDLIDAHLRGVEIRVIMDATGASNGYTKHELLRAVGIPVKIENWGGKMHMKSALIDGETLIVGSMNWTSAGEWDNDENTLIIRDAALAQQYQGFFDTLWAELPDTWLTRNPDPESKDSGNSCADGVDNDHDHLADDQDPGCGPNPPAMDALPPHWIIDKTQVTCQHPPT